jgi:SPP1 family predicted phage head-tail adaptor
LNGRFIDPGRFRTELSLQQATLTQDGMGGHVESWAEVATVFALIEPISAEARFGSDQSLETTTHRITMRHRAHVASGMRLVRGERVFELLTVHDPDESGRYLVCRAREKGR